jgi:uncharacterized protein with PIN domain
VSEAIFRFYGSLNDFLPPARRQLSFTHAFDGRVSIKDVIESFGVPHPEIDLVIAGGTPVSFSYHLQLGDRVAVYPLFCALDVGAISLVRPPALRDLRFVLDTHLGRLAAYLRLAGLDCVYSNHCDDEELAEISSRETRVLLTRDAALLKRTIVEYGYWVRETNPRRQLAEIFSRFDLASRARPFRRCLRCNALIEAVPKAGVVDRLPPRTREHCHEFYRCPGCGRIYWKGSHYEWMRRLIEGRCTE